MRSERSNGGGLVLMKVQPSVYLGDVCALEKERPEKENEESRRSEEEKRRRRKWKEEETGSCVLAAMDRWSSLSGR